MQQDSTHIVRHVPVDSASTTQTVSSPHRAVPATPVSDEATAIRDSLTAVPDTIVYQPQPLPLPEEHEETACMPAAFGWENLIRQQPEPAAARLDFLNDSLPRFEFTAEQIPLQGIAGDAIPYSFKNDSFVTVILMLSFFLMTWVLTRSRHYLSEQASEYFNNRKHHDNSTDNLHSELNGKTLMVFQTCFIIGLIFFDLTQEVQKEVFLHVDPYKILGTATAVSLGYYLLKILAYRFVNAIFFDRQQCSTWNETYLLHILLTGLILFPLVLLIIYFDLNFTRLLTLFIGLVIVAKTLLLYKCHCIFFNYTLGWVHLFLYFCTLEIVPLLFLVRAMVYANNFLLTTN